MNKETVIALAREAGFADGVVEIVGLEGFSRFFDLARAWEREECAKVCDDWPNGRDDVDSIAAAIRSRT